MKRIVIACETLRDELERAMEVTQSSFEVTWVDSNYHMDPNGLRIKLQEEIDKITGADTILLAYGCCGNGLIGLDASTADLIIPKTDDCISMVLCKPEKKFNRLKKTYFLTKGWIDSSRGLMEEYVRAVERYGEAKAERIFRLMLKSYRYLMLIDTGAYNIYDYVPRAKEIADITHLDLIVRPGGTWLLEKLLTGPYDDDFCIIPKGEEVKIGHFGYDEGLGQTASINMF